MLKATIRSDAASIFAENNKWGFFPSVALGWRINQEKWLKDIKWINNLKLRFSYGVSGKQAITPYQSLATASFGNVSMDGSTFSSYLFFDRLGNENLKWEKTGEYNLGVDFAVLNDRLSFSVDAYLRKTTQLLFNDPLPGYSGYDEQTRNIGSIQNKGLELAVMAVPYKDRNWEWSMNFNLSTNRSEILSLGIKPDKFISMNSRFTDSAYLKVGEELGNIYGYESDGIWKSSAEISQAKAAGLPYVYKDVRPGFTRFVDKNGDGALTDADKGVIGNAFPNFTGGLTNTLNYKGFSLNFTMLFSLGNEIFNATRYDLEGIHDSRGQASAALKDMWTPNLYYYDPITGEKGNLFRQGNPNGNIATNMTARTTIYNTDVPFSDYVENASFLRMSDLTLSYTLPLKLSTRIKASNARIFVTAANLFTVTKYKGADPEVNSALNEASFLAPGLDFFPYPKARTFSLGVNLTF